MTVRYNWITIGTAIEVIKKSGKEYSKYIYFLNGCLATFIATFSFINFSVQYYIFEKNNAKSKWLYSIRL